VKIVFMCSIMLSLLRVSASESMITRPCFQALNTVYIQFCYMFTRSDIYFRLHLLLIIIHITCISLSLCQTSAPIYLISVLGVLATQETSCIVIAGLLERDSFDLLLPEIDKSWVIHLRETCYCSTNLCTWRPNTVYKDRSVRRHQPSAPGKNYSLLIMGDSNVDGDGGEVDGDGGGGDGVDGDGFGDTSPSWQGEHRLLFPEIGLRR
jgi:hypothetical protein